MLNMVFEAVHQIKGTDPASLAEDTLIESLKFDSLDEVEIMMTLEDRIGIEVDQASIRGCRTLGDLAKVLSDLKAKTAS